MCWKSEQTRQDCDSRSRRDSCGQHELLVDHGRIVCFGRPLGIRWLYRFALRGFHVGAEEGCDNAGVGRRHEQPSGVMTLMLTGVVGSSGLWQRSTAATGQGLVRHTALIEAAGDSAIGSARRAVADRGR
jgi:hypothetical protein